MNFVFFFTDQQRAESVSCYGHPLVQMPHYDRLAAQGVRFEQCHTQAALCCPARCAMFTGLYPHVSGHRSLWNLLKPNEPNLFLYLKQAGYCNVAHGKNDLFTKPAADACMDVFAKPDGTNWGGNPFHIDDNRYYSFMREPCPSPVHETFDMRCVQSGIDFIKARKRSEKPFFLYLPLVLPHPGYSAPHPYHHMYNADDIPPLRPVADGPDIPAFRRQARQYRRLDTLPERFFREINAVYLGMNSYVDWMLGNLLDALDASEVADDTVFILSSDHGDFAGDYGLVEKIHNQSLDVMTRVPLIIRAPGCAAGTVSRGQVELLDLMATVMDYAGIEARHTHFSRSLRPQVEGAPGDPDRASFFELGFNEHETQCLEGWGSTDGWLHKPSADYYPQAKQLREHTRGMARTVSMRTDQYKLVRRPADVDELYDLVSDPRETVNVYNNPAYRAVRDQLNERMLAWLITTSDTVPFERDSRDF